MHWQTYETSVGVYPALSATRAWIITRTQIRPQNSYLNSSNDSGQIVDEITRRRKMARIKGLYPIDTQSNYYNKAFGKPDKANVPSERFDMIKLEADTDLWQAALREPNIKGEAAGLIQLRENLQHRRALELAPNEDETTMAFNDLPPPSVSITTSREDGTVVQPLANTSIGSGMIRGGNDRPKPPPVPGKGNPEKEESKKSSEEKDSPS